MVNKYYQQMKSIAKMTELKAHAILKKIRDEAEVENIRLTQHAQQEMAEEDISIDEVLEAIASGMILENYPEHRRGSCCLVNGKTKAGKPLHIVCTTALPILIIITTSDLEMSKRQFF
jgi:hypothetical protein